jgi:hypothetical protein
MIPHNLDIYPQSESQATDINFKNNLVYKKKLKIVGSI